LEPGIKKPVGKPLKKPLKRSEIAYEGPLVLESFSSVVPEMIAVSCMWRPSKLGIDEMVSRSLQFIKQKASAYGLD